MPGETKIERQSLPVGRVPVQRPAIADVPLPPGEQSEPSYYDVSILKAPTWEWQIAWYFFLGGLSGGSFVLARLAERFGGQQYRRLTQAGTAIAMAALAPCPVLLIWDLGDPKRFHHMLRVFKPRSPMNFGAWVLTAYSGPAAIALLREWLRGAGGREDRFRTTGLGERVVMAVVDATGLPLALLVAGYTGVLLSCTATPIWCQNNWLGPLFSAGGIANGSTAIRLALELLGSDDEQTEKATHTLEKIGTVAHLTEATSLGGFLTSAGTLAKPMLEGQYAPWLWGAVAGLATSEILDNVAPRGKRGRWTRIAGAAIGLVSGFAIRWATVHAGRPSADDPDAARKVSRPRASTTRDALSSRPNNGPSLVR